MEIISTRLGFNADHSSSYEFVALEKRLSKEKQLEVEKLGVSTNSYQASTQSGKKREYLLRNYYDIMYQYDYDYLNVSIALWVTEKEKMELQRYEFTGEDDRGLEVWIEVETFRDQPERVIVSLYAELYIEKLYGKKFDSKLRNSDDFLRFLARIQEELKNHNYEALYAFVEKYGTEDDLNSINPLENKNSETYKLMKMILNE